MKPVCYQTEAIIKIGVLSMIKKYYSIRSDQYFRQKLKEAIAAYREVCKARRICLED